VRASTVRSANLTARGCSRHEHLDPVGGAPRLGRNPRTRANSSALTIGWKQKSGALTARVPFVARAATRRGLLLQVPDPGKGGGSGRRRRGDETVGRSWKGAHPLVGRPVLHHGKASRDSAST
jgi:hypothetical protein